MCVQKIWYFWHSWDARRPLCPAFEHPQWEDLHFLVVLAGGHADLHQPLFCFPLGPSLLSSTPGWPPQVQDPESNWSRFGRVHHQECQVSRQSSYPTIHCLRLPGPNPFGFLDVENGSSFFSWAATFIQLCSASFVLTLTGLWWRSMLFLSQNLHPMAGD